MLTREQARWEYSQGILHYLCNFSEIKNYSNTKSLFKKEERKKTL